MPIEVQAGSAPALSRRELFERDGLLHLKGFAEPDECEALRRRMRELVDAWDPSVDRPPVFETGYETQKYAQGSSDYFLDSADRIHFFLEKGAAAEDGKLKPAVEKLRALNKVGHGLHVADDVFRKYSMSEKVTSLVAELGWNDPMLPQSMYIFKQPVIGGEVTSHQDSSFLYTEPSPTCVGLWLALDAATLENGCLWARPGSHREPLRRRFVRNPEHFEGGDASKPQMVFEDLDGGSGEADQWEGRMPDGWEAPSVGLKEKGFAAVQCEAGDLVVIHGLVDHLSLPNSSEKPRETFQLHLIEGPRAGVRWSPRNWLQYPPGKSFPSLKGGPDAKRKADEL